LAALQQTTAKFVRHQCRACHPTPEKKKKKISILVPAAVAGVLLAAMVLAAPQTSATSVVAGEAPNRAEAFVLASSN
jgi:hypothetical protein